jgi:hypothetical protein
MVSGRAVAGIRIRTDSIIRCFGNNITFLSEDSISDGANLVKRALRFKFDT